MIKIKNRLLIYILHLSISLISFSNLFCQSTTLFVTSEIDYGDIITYNTNFEQQKLRLKKNWLDTIILNNKYYNQIGLTPNLCLKNPGGFILLANEKAYLNFDKTGKASLSIYPKNQLNKLREIEFNSYHLNLAYTENIKSLLEKGRSNEALQSIIKKGFMDRDKIEKFYSKDTSNNYLFYRTNFEKISFESYIIRFKLKENLYPEIDSFHKDLSSFLQLIGGNECNYSIASINASSLIIYDLNKNSKLKASLDDLIMLFSNFIPKTYFRDKLFKQLYKISNRDEKDKLTLSLKGLMYYDSTFLQNTENKPISNNLIDISNKEIVFDSILQSLKGKLTYIDFWASWCAPCIAEFPEMRKLKESYKHNVNFIFISLDKEFNFWIKNIEKFGLHDVRNFMSFSNIFSLKGNKHIIGSIPRSILLDQNGEIIMLNAPRPGSKQIHALLKKL